YTGPYPYIDGLIFRYTRNFTTIEVKHSTREEGKSNYNWRKLISIFLNILFCYSALPIRLFIPIGLGIWGVGSLLLLYLTYRWSVGPGRTCCHLVMSNSFLIGGLQSIVIFIL